MRLTLRVDATGIERKFDLLAASVRDLKPVLREFDDYLAARIRLRFEQQGPGWPPLAQASRASRERASLRVLQRRLGTELWRAEDRQAKRLAALEAAGEDTARKRAAFARTLQRRLGTIVELRRHIAGQATESLSARLLPRVARAQERAGRMLGRVASSFRSTIEAGRLTRESAIPWAGVHNVGGTAGHGARIPARPFIFLEEEDADALVEMLRERMLLALE